jgi:hypothetical protein
VLQKELYNLHIHIYVSCKALFEAPCIINKLNSAANKYSVRKTHLLLCWTSSLQLAERMECMQKFLGGRGSSRFYDAKDERRELSGLAPHVTA